MIQLVTSKRFIGELLEDLNISSSDYVHRFYSWIEYGIGMMDLAKFYTHRAKVVEIKNHKGMLPCDTKFFHSMWVEGTKPCGNYGLSYIQLSTSPLVGKDFKGYPIANNKISIEGRFINSDKEKQKVLVVYRGVPKDEEGYPMIPDNPFVFEALNFYIIYRLGMKGVEHPLIKWSDAYQLWLQAYPRASNDVNWMTPAEYEEFTTFWNSPYMGNMVSQLYIS